MPEFPDVTIYVECLSSRIVDRPLQKIRLTSPFVLRTFDPPLQTIEGRPVEKIMRVGKQIVWAFGQDLFLVFHLMIAGRFHWKRAGAKAPRKIGLAAFDFPDGTLLFTEASTKKRASMHLVQGTESMTQFEKGGLEVFAATRSDFRRVLQSENHTLKRSLTDPRLFSAIGNAYSDEILHRARLSPLQLTQKLDSEETDRLFQAVQSTLTEWTDRLRKQTGDGFPEKVTAFHPEMAVHGKYGQPCPACGTTVQRIVYADNECNYCPKCQTGGKILADRSLSRLLNDDWPRTIDEL